jgi:hypothetical protein
VSVVVITPPGPIVDLPVVKQHLRVDSGDEDALIQLYIDAAQGMIDGPAGWLGRCIGQQELQLRLDGFPHAIWGWDNDAGGLFWGSDPGFGGRVGSGRIKLPYPPLIAVSSVTYEDSTGTTQTLPSADYLASDEGLEASYGSSFPNGRWEPNAVSIEYSAGYTTVPSTIVSAVLLMVGDLYSNRETTLDARGAGVAAVPMSTTVEALLAPFRVFG